MTPKKIAARFHAMLKEKEGEYGRGFNKFLHGETGISTGYLSEIIAGDKPGSQETQMKICSALDFNYNILLAEDATLPTLQSTATASEQPSNMHNLSDHQKMVERFKNKKLGESINEKLLAIEEVDPEYLVDLDEILEKKLQRLQEKTASKTPGPQEKSSGS